MTIKELFGHAIGVVKFGDIAKFYNWLTKRDHTLKGDITFTGEVNFTDATVTGLPSGGGGIYGGSGEIPEDTFATMMGDFIIATPDTDILAYTASLEQLRIASASTIIVGTDTIELLGGPHIRLETEDSGLYISEQGVRVSNGFIPPLELLPKDHLHLNQA